MLETLPTNNKKVRGSQVCNNQCYIRIWPSGCHLQVSKELTLLTIASCFGLFIYILYICTDQCLQHIQIIP